MRLVKLMLCLGLFMGHVGLALAAPNAYVLEFNGGVAVLDTAPNTLLPNTLNVGNRRLELGYQPRWQSCLHLQYRRSTGGANHHHRCGKQYHHPSAGPGGLHQRLMDHHQP